MSITSIQLNALGEQIDPYTGMENREKNLIPLGGFHTHCGGVLNRRQITEDEAALFCRECGLRVVIPENISNWAALEQWSRQQVWTTE